MDQIIIYQNRLQNGNKMTVRVSVCVCVCVSFYNKYISLLNQYIIAASSVHHVPQCDLCIIKNNGYNKKENWDHTSTSLCRIGINFMSKLAKCRQRISEHCP